MEMLDGERMLYEYPKIGLFITSRRVIHAPGGLSHGVCMQKIALEDIISARHHSFRRIKIGSHHGNITLRQALRFVFIVIVLVVPWAVLDYATGFLGDVLLLLVMLVTNRADVSLFPSEIRIISRNNKIVCSAGDMSVAICGALCISIERAKAERLKQLEAASM